LRAFLLDLEMPTTANKGYSTPAFNTQTGLWGTVDLNGNFQIQDNNLGGVASVSLSNANVTLTSAQAQNLTVFLTGTLTASVVVSTPCIGFFWIVNNTTGAFTVSIQANFGSGAVGSASIVPQGARVLFVSDTTNGLQIGSSSFPSGTKTVFYQASAPSGWTQVVTYNDYLPRIVSGTGGAATSGSGFSSINASVTTAGHTLTTAEMPSHSHTDAGHYHAIGANFGTAGGSTFLAPYQNSQTGATGVGYASLSNTGGGGAHTHGLALGISYLDLILCTKN